MSPNSFVNLKKISIVADMKPSENTKEFVLEAALFCKKAQCEAKMSEEEKQRLVV